MFKGFLLIIAAIILRGFSKLLETHGDSLATGAERLPWHLSALGLLICAGIAFVWGLIAIVRRR